MDCVGFLVDFLCFGFKKYLFLLGQCLASSMPA